MPAACRSCCANSRPHRPRRADRGRRHPARRGGGGRGGAGQTVIRSPGDPIKPIGAMAVLRGNLAPRGAVIKHSAATPGLLSHTGRRWCSTRWPTSPPGWTTPDLDVAADDVLVLRNAGPKGAPGMPEAGYLPIPKKLARQGVKDMVRVSDARMSGTAFGTIVLHVTPESAVGGPLALVRTGDRIRLDVPARRIDLLVDEAELAARAASLPEAARPDWAARGYARLFHDTVTQADEGATSTSCCGSRRRPREGGRPRSARIPRHPADRAAAEPSRRARPAGQPLETRPCPSLPRRSPWARGRGADPLRHRAGQRRRGRPRPCRRRGRGPADPRDRAGAVLRRAGAGREDRRPGAAVGRAAAPAIVAVDAGHGFAYPALEAACAALPEVARAEGLAAAPIRRSHHCGAAGLVVEALAAQGFVALLFANAPAAMAPWGRDGAAVRHQPIAFACPLPGRDPIVIDLALSKVARGHIVAAQKRGEPIPEGWGPRRRGPSDHRSRRGARRHDGAARRRQGHGARPDGRTPRRRLTGGRFAAEASSFLDITGARPRRPTDPRPRPRAPSRRTRDPLRAAGGGGRGAGRPPPSRSRRLAARERARAEGLTIGDALLAEIAAA